MEVFGGARYASIKSWLGWNFSGDFGLLGRSGSLSDKLDLVDGIVGVRGQVALGDERHWHVPYYVDVGAGSDSNTTWQGYTGAGYRYSWGDLVLLYRSTTGPAAAISSKTCALEDLSSRQSFAGSDDLRNPRPPEHTLCWHDDGVTVENRSCSGLLQARRLKQ